MVPITHPNAGKGNHYQIPHRLRCIERMRMGWGLSDFGPTLYAMRTDIERRFGNATSFSTGSASGSGPSSSSTRPAS